MVASLRPLSALAGGTLIAISETPMAASSVAKHTREVLKSRGYVIEKELVLPEHFSLRGRRIKPVRRMCLQITPAGQAVVDTLMKEVYS